MREIKFRAWCEIDKEYEKDISHFTMDFFENDIYKHNVYIWEQFTGLQDKNGVDIYEGDIVKTDSYERHYITWSDMHSRFCTRALDNIGGTTGIDINCEIIGNIHEQKESNK